MDPVIEASWKTVLHDQFNLPYFHELKQFLIEEKKQFTIFPAGGDIFNAFKYTPFNRVKVVLLGQDPYHGLGQAHGLCFSVREGVALPPSLVNIFKELCEDVGCPFPRSGNLEKWARQGVLLLNATLTVRQNMAGSHQGKGWETFTNEAIRTLSSLRENIVFLLWGSFAQKKAELIDTSKHLILKTVHPSPLSAYRGFLGCRHFSKANQWLQSRGQEPVDWQLD
ncbi:MAG: uracil-DNA glycosylase [Bacteroidales bacterium]|nr:uracil-DNA glycosylase [Bacteroidales bacterium]